MSWSWNNSSKIVRPRSTRHTPLLPCLLAFVVTASLIYYWGSTSSSVPAHGQSTFTATAYVVEPSAKTLSGQLRIPLAYTDANADRAEEVVNALADRYVEDRRTESNRRLESTQQKARKAAESARQELVQCEAKLEQFRRQAAEATAKPHEVMPREKTSAMVENPRWIDLNLQLSELEQRRERLLLDRTALHPSVVDITSQIDDLKGQMAAVPRQIPDTANKAANKNIKTAETTPDDDSRVASDREKLHVLTTAARKARQSLATAEAAERRLRKGQQTGPQYTVVYAKVEKNIPPQVNDQQRLLWTTLVAGMFMAFGVGSISTGISIEPAAATVAQVQADAHTTVIGAIPAENPIPDPVALSRHQMRDRQALLAIGLILMAACPAVAIWGTVGI